MSSDERREMLTDGMLSVPEAMQFTRLSRTELYEAMGRHELPFVKHGRRRLIPKRAVIALMEKGLATVG